MINSTLSFMKGIFTLLGLVCLATFANAQTTPLDSLNNRVTGIAKQLESLQRIKLSGYVQAQFQDSDSSGIGSFDGGSFPTGSDKRFTVRRGRLKAQYDHKITQIALQIDITERGVGIKEAYGKITEPLLNAFSLTAGAFNRPWGFETPYSSANWEYPERSRVSQTLFPSEQDLGAMLTFQMPKSSPWNFLKLDAGLFNGTGLSPEIDFQKDVIGNITLTKASKNEKVKVIVGASYYNGGVAQGNKYVFRLTQDTAFHFKVDSSNTFVYRPEPRAYIGGHAQVSFVWPAGTTTLRGEYYQGNTVGTSGSTLNPAALPGALSSSFYVRDFNGATFVFLHDIVKTPVQLVARYDWYDPNTEVSSNDIGAGGSNLNATDIKYATIGFGANVRIGSNAKLLAYYSMPTNESTKLSKWTQDIKDNVLTLRMQYRF
jgi:hypothetical protein